MKCNIVINLMILTPPKFIKQVVEKAILLHSKSMNVSLTLIDYKSSNLQSILRFCLITISKVGCFMLSIWINKNYNFFSRVTSYPLLYFWHVFEIDLCSIMDEKQCNFRNMLGCHNYIMRLYTRHINLSIHNYII